MSSWKSPIDGLFSGGKGSGSPYKPKPRSGQKVERDGQGRIVRLTAVVNREDLNRGSDTNQAVRDYIRANLGADPKGALIFLIYFKMLIRLKMTNIK